MPHNTCGNVLWWLFGSELLGTSSMVNDLFFASWSSMTGIVPLR